MTPNEIITAAKKKVKDTTTNLDWNTFYSIVIDRIFTRRVWKFSTQEINYLHSQDVAEKTFNDTATEKSLNHIRHIRLTTSYNVVMEVPIPAGGTAKPIDVVSPQEFFDRYPDNVQSGVPEIATILVANDGTNGMQISLAPRPNTQAAVWVLGDFIPAYTIDSNPMPILPLQFHWIVIDGVASLAAEEKGEETLSRKWESRFERGIVMMESWDRKNPAHKPRLHQNPGMLGEPLLPPNFDWRGR